jgi:L-2-hydroxyglutarate oxidase LhgO
VPAIADDDITPDLSGIRAKLQGPGDGFRDFVIADETARGLPGLIDLIGIDSPGLTSSLAIADEVARLLGV